MLKRLFLRKNIQYFGVFFVYQILKCLILTFTILIFLFNEQQIHPDNLGLYDNFPYCFCHTAVLLA